MIQSNTSNAETPSSQESASLAAPRLDPAFKAKWLAALRSGEYQQCQGALRANGGYCCIGVAAVVVGYGIDTAFDRVLRPGQTAEDARSYDALEDFGLFESSAVIEMNDKGDSFAVIAEYIEANL